MYLKITIFQQIPHIAHRNTSFFPGELNAVLYFLFRKFTKNCRNRTYILGRREYVKFNPLLFENIIGPVIFESVDGKTLEKSDNSSIK